MAKNRDPNLGRVVAVFLAGAREFLDQGRHGEAVHQLGGALEIDPDNQEARSLLSAVRTTLAAQASDPEIRALLREARAAALEGRVAEVEALADQVLELAPDSQEALRLLKYTYEGDESLLEPARPGASNTDVPPLLERIDRLLTAKRPPPKPAAPSTKIATKDGAREKAAVEAPPDRSKSKGPSGWPEAAPAAAATAEPSKSEEAPAEIPATSPARPPAPEPSVSPVPYAEGPTRARFGRIVMVILGAVFLLMWWSSGRKQDPPPVAIAESGGGPLVDRPPLERAEPPVVPRGPEPDSGARDQPGGAEPSDASTAPPPESGLQHRTAPEPGDPAGGRRDLQQETAGGESPDRAPEPPAQDPATEPEKMPGLELFVDEPDIGEPIDVLPPTVVTALPLPDPEPAPVAPPHTEPPLVPPTLRTPPPAVPSRPSGSDRLRDDAIRSLAFVTIPAGTFDMGCATGDSQCGPYEKPRRKVRISRSFQLSSYETSNLAYAKCVEAGTCRRPSGSPHFEEPAKTRHPIVGVDWNEAMTFCRWLGGRLPTEAEWEYAARGTYRGSLYPNGAKTIDHDDANFEGTGGQDTWEGTSPVGSFPAEGRGLHDMSGNAREWVLDWHAFYSKGKPTDPTGPDDGQLKIIRGGSWDRSEEHLRVSARSWGAPNARMPGLGFRCMLPALGQSL